MWEIILGVVVITVFVIGGYYMNRLDSYLQDNYENRKTESKKEPFCIILAENMSEEEIIQEIRCFREKHEYTGILLYDDPSMENVLR